VNGSVWYTYDAQNQLISCPNTPLTDDPLGRLPNINENGTVTATNAYVG
jgi:hypothetical protein